MTITLHLGKSGLSCGSSQGNWKLHVHRKTFSVSFALNFVSTPRALRDVDVVGGGGQETAMDLRFHACFLCADTFALFINGIYPRLLY